MRYYFDTSSLVKIYHREKGSETALDIYKGKNEIVISELGRIEFLSTLYRKFREHEITIETLQAVIHKFDEDIDCRYEILKFSSAVTDEARNLLSRLAEKHSLRTLDSVQFAFFRTYCEDDTIFICSDAKLTALVQEEGIKILNP